MRTEWERDFADGHLAVVELSAAEAKALAEAVSFYVRRRFGSCELELSGKALALRSLVGVSDRLAGLAEADLGGRVILTEGEVRGARDALCLYIAERDVEQYQPLEERERLAELHAMSDPLGDLLTRLPRSPAPAPLAIR